MIVFCLLVAIAFWFLPSVVKLRRAAVRSKKIAASHNFVVQAATLAIALLLLPKGKNKAIATKKLVRPKVYRQKVSSFATLSFYEKVKTKLLLLKWKN